MRGIILHGGHGTRLRPLTHTGPKQLLPIANKPMSQHCLESMRDGGIMEIAIVIGGNGFQKVKDHYGDGGAFGVKITYVFQDRPRGIAHAVGLCRDFVGDERFVVFLGDNILKRDIADYVSDFEGSEADAILLLCKVDNPSQFGIADLNDDGSICRIMEKPENPPTDMAVTGIYFLTPKIFGVIDRTEPSRRGELEITDALQNLLQEGGTIRHHSVMDYWKDTGTPGDIIHANRVLLEDMTEYFLGSREPGAVIEGKVMVGSGTRIRGKARITGPAIIGENCTIEDGAELGPNLSIGDNTVIGRCRARDSIIMSDCRIEADVSMSDSIVSSGSKIARRTSDESVFLLGEGTRIIL